MKKLLLILLCVPLMFSFGENKKDTENEKKKEIENDLTEENIKVKQITGTTYVIASEEIYRKDKYLYNKDGNKTEWEGTALGIEDGLEVQRYWNEKYKYNEDGNMTERTSYNANGEIDGKNKYLYNKDGNMTEMTSYNANGELGSNSKYKYDEDGNKTEWKYYDGELATKYKYQYDEDGNEMEKSGYRISDGRLSLKFNYQYDEDGNMIGNSSYGYPSDWNYTYQYEFDKLNNWIVRTRYEDGNPLEITEREIEYYE